MSFSKQAKTFQISLAALLNPPSFRTTNTLLSLIFPLHNGSAVQDTSYPFTSRTAWHRESHFGLGFGAFSSSVSRTNTKQPVWHPGIRTFALCCAEGRSEDAVGRVTWHRITLLHFPQHPLEIWAPWSSQHNCPGSHWLVQAWLMIWSA